MTRRLALLMTLSLAVLSGCGIFDGLASRDRGEPLLCGVPELEGRFLPEIDGRMQGCGVASPVQVTRVAGVSLSQASIMDCPTARALDTWLRDGAQPIIGTRGGGISELRVVAHYVCKTRNGRPGARISEHGRGKAVDIAAIGLADGTELTVARDWRGANSEIMRGLHRAACGPFGTVLGPASDRFHQGHFHFDTADYRSGPYCR